MVYGGRCALSLRHLSLFLSSFSFVASFLLSSVADLIDFIDYHDSALDCDCSFRTQKRRSYGGNGRLKFEPALSTGPCHTVRVMILKQKPKVLSLVRQMH